MISQPSMVGLFFFFRGFTTSIRLPHNGTPTTTPFQRKCSIQLDGSLVPHKSNLLLLCPGSSRLRFISMVRFLRIMAKIKGPTTAPNCRLLTAVSMSGWPFSSPMIRNVVRRQHPRQHPIKRKSRGRGTLRFWVFLLEDGIRRIFLPVCNKDSSLFFSWSFCLARNLIWGRNIFVDFSYRKNTESVLYNWFTHSALFAAPNVTCANNFSFVDGIESYFILYTSCCNRRFLR